VSIAEVQPGRPDKVEVFDLRDAEAWERAGSARVAWGRHRSEIHTLDNDHVVIIFRGGEERSLEAAS
jgi:hypothetical protein